MSLPWGPISYPWIDPSGGTVNLSGYSIADAEAELVAMLHGTTLNQIQNPLGLFNRTAREILGVMDAQETKRNVVMPIFQGVWNYPIAPDVKGNRLIDLNPVNQVNRSGLDQFPQSYVKAFSLTAANGQANDLNISYDAGTRFIRVAAPFITQSVTVNTTDSVTGNGTWVTSGAVTGLTQENLNFVTQTSALRYSMNGSGSTGFIENGTMSPIDLSSMNNEGTFFVYVYIPFPSLVTSFALRWGSDPSNFWESTATYTQLVTSFQTGWNLLAFPWVSAVSTGAPDNTAINYLRFTTNSATSSAQTGLIFNGVIAELGAEYQYSYYSKFLFRDSTSGVFQELATDTSNNINLDTDSFNVFLWLAAHNAVQQQQGINATFFDDGYFHTKYLEALARYQAVYKSEFQKPTSIYYAMPRPNTYINRFRRITGN